MKVAYLTNPYMVDSDFPLIRSYQQKGIDVYVLIELVPRSCKATLFSIEKQIKRNAIIKATEYPELRIYERYFDLDKVFILNRMLNTRYSWSYVKASWLQYKFLRKGHFDIVHASHFLGSPRSWIYKRFKPWVTTVHDPVPHSDEKNRKGKNEVRRKLLNLSEGVVLLNKNQRDEFCQRYDVPSEKILCNRIGIYDYMNVFLANRVEKKPCGLLFFGNIRPYKGLEYLCEAMRKVRSSVTEATLTIVGSGNIYFNIEPYIREGLVVVHNRFISQQELSTFLAGNSLCVCPYTDATQSGVIMTAYSMTVPVVATEVGGLSEMVKDGYNGLLVPPRDVERLADAIISLLNNQKKLQEFSNNITHDYCEGEKSWSHIADTYLDFYNTLIEKTKKS